MNKYYTVYQITNLLNNHIYIGCHTTNDLGDNYYGSGTNIRKAIKEFGKHNFKKEILFILDDTEQMLNKERELVNEEFIKRTDTYNIVLGGFYNTTGTITVKDINGNTSKVHVTDSRYLSGELEHLSKGMLVVKDKYGNNFRVSVNDPKYLSGEFVSTSKNMVNVKDTNGNISKVHITDPRYLSGEYTSIFKDSVMVKDLNNNIFRVSIDDPKYLSGEYVFYWKGKTHTEESIRKMSRANKHQKGKNNSQYGKCWIYNLELKESRKVEKNEVEKYLLEGWIRGRKMSFTN